MRLYPLARLGLCFAAAAASSLFAPSAEASAIYGIDNYQLFRIDGSSGNANLVGQLLPAPVTGTSPAVFDLAGGGNSLWALVLDYVGTTSTTRLAQVNTQTASLTLLPTISVPLPGRRIDTIAYDAATATMYGLSSGTTRSLYTIDLVTGAATLVGATGMSSSALNRSLTLVNGELYAAPFTTTGGSSTAQLHHIDKATGLATAVSTLISGQIGDLAWDPDTDVLYSGGYVADSTGASLGALLQRVDPLTGAASTIGSTTASNIWSGLAVLDDATVPEPSTMLLVAAAAGALLRRSRR